MRHNWVANNEAWLIGEKLEATDWEIAFFVVCDRSRRLTDSTAEFEPILHAMIEIMYLSIYLSITPVGVNFDILAIGEKPERE